MKNIIFALVAASAFTHTNVTLAAGDNESDQPLAGESRSHLRVGVTTYLERYREYDNGTKLMQEEAQMAGLKLEHSHQFYNGGQLVLSGSIAGGDATYTGAYWGGSYGDVKATGLSRTTIDLSAVYKMTLPTRFNSLVIGGGFGYRTLDDRLDKAGEGGYRRKNQRIYALLSAERTIMLNEQWEVTPTLAYHQIVHGWQHSSVGDGITHAQNSGNGFSLAAPFTKKTSHGSAVIAPFWREWNISGTNPTADTIEPANKTTEIGVTLSWEY